MGGALDRDVHALQEWLRRAWRYVASPSITRYQRCEMRNQMRQAEEALRTALKKRGTRLARYSRSDPQEAIAFRNP